MLLELLQYLTNPGSQFARRLGYSKELIAIEARFKRHKILWKAHLDNTQKFILNTARQCPRHDAIIILGAGLLYDIPIKQLSERFKQVYLVDVIFSRSTQNIARKLGNVKTLVHDLNGFAEQNKAFNQPQAVPEIRASLPATEISPNLIVSANILSQLYLAPVHQLQKHSSLSDAEIYNFGKKLLLGHLALLKNQSAQVCLITDYQRINIDKQNHRQEGSALLDIDLPAPDMEWLWPVAPKGELARNESMETVVYAYANFN